MDQRPLPEDFKEFIVSLNSNKVIYLLIGGWAVGFYGNPRATKDIDFLVAIDDTNLEKLQKALSEFGAPTIDINKFKKKDNVFRMGRSPIQIDIITEASGIDIKDCYSRRNMMNLDGIDILVISKEDLLRNKRASGRHGDLADVESLEGDSVEE